MTNSPSTASKSVTDARLARLARGLLDNRYLLLCALVVEASLAGLLYVGDLGARVTALWALLVPAFAAYGVACAWVLRRGGCGSPHLILASAAVFRLTLVGSTPSLSDDIYRYVWDGRVQVADINPYRYAPQEEALEHLRDGDYVAINHRDIPTIYPPLAQMVFRAVASISPSVWGMKACFLACEAATIWVLVLLLRLRDADPRRVLLYAWNPLAVVEIAGSGHMDAVPLLFVMSGLYFALRLRPHAAALALTGGVLAKLVPILLLPLLWRHLGSRAGSSLTRLLHPGGRWPLLWVPLVVTGGYLLYAEPGVRFFEGLEVYAEKWRFNDAAFTVVYEYLRQPGLAWDDDALERAHEVCGALLVAAALWALVRVADLPRAAFATLGAYLLLSPTLHPWYLLWVLPFLPLFPSLPWLVFSGLVFLAYQVLAGYSSSGVWQQAAWVKWAEYVPFYALLSMSVLRAVVSRVGCFIDARRPRV